MSGSSCSSYLGRQRGLQEPGPALPLVRCPDCGLLVKKWVSGTPEHPGWTLYRCKNHGTSCNFWHWEREYVYYLVRTRVLIGDAGVEAVGWAEERREELESALRKKNFTEEWGRASGPKREGSSTNQTDGMLMRELLLLGREMLFLLKIVVAVLSVGMVVGVAMYLKK